MSDTAALSSRIDAAISAAEKAGLDALLITPGPALTYLTGYRALPLERLTCLLLTPGLAPVMVVPRLEAPAALAASTGSG